jgi:deferrochelatase/peroxidase EfeB
MGSLQNGIYYNKGSRPGESLGIIFLRANESSSAEIIKKIWDTCKNLKKGTLKGLELDYPKFYSDLTVLIGYGPKIFNLKGASRKRPTALKDDLSFSDPRKRGISIFPGASLFYHNDVTDNHAASDHIVIQFISNYQFVTNQAIAEVWRELLEVSEEEKYENKLGITSFYDGFRREDNRSWMGFLDGLSNLKPAERENVIAINRSQVRADEHWLVNGTFMSFIRIFIDLESWWQKKTSEQELLVGRKKSTGCPIIGYDKSNNPVNDKNCPVTGTRDVTESGNARFRDHPPYGFQRLRPGISDENLKFSHIGAMRIIGKERMWQKEQYSIFRQGFEFLEQTNSYPGIRAGLNFISFQNDPKRLFNTMTKWNENRSISATNKWNHKITNYPKTLELNTYFRIWTAGLFLVPPHNENEPFPGSSIFFSGTSVRRMRNIWNN